MSSHDDADEDIFAAIAPATAKPAATLEMPASNESVCGKSSLELVVFCFLNDSAWSSSGDLFPSIRFFTIGVVTSGCLFTPLEAFTR